MQRRKVRQSLSLRPLEYFAESPGDWHATGQ
jgi:hypothetical protein